MKKLLSVLFAAVLFLGLGANAVQATSLTYGDAYYLGYVNDAIPSNVDDTVGYINNLITLAAGAGPTVIGTESYSRVGSALPGPFPVAVALGGVKTDTSIGSGINVTGWTYLLGKYDAHNAGAYVWYVAGLETADIPNFFNAAGQYGLSHYTLLNHTQVPDGGATLMLLGGALVGLGALRRKFRA
jgi:hypothetical protein